MNMTEINEKAKIDYPSQWSYKVILGADENASQLIAGIMGDKPYTLSPSKSSENEKFKSYNLQTQVQDEHERLAIFGALKNIAKYVL